MLEYGRMMNEMKIPKKCYDKERQVSLWNDLTKFIKKPDLFAAGTDLFWNNEHISKMLLKAHLNPENDAASRQLSFIDQSVTWIAQKIPPVQYTKLLDLGCGPGLYAERFTKIGYDVMGIDFSKRSINYAREQALLLNKSNLSYHYQNYLTIDFDDKFDVVTLIYCDFGALSTQNRQIVLNKIYKALKPGGKLILDVFTSLVYLNKKENRSWQYYENGGFWSDKPHLSLDTIHHYDGDTTELRQSIVHTENSVNCYNIWEHFFTKETFISEMQAVKFTSFELYGDVAGKEFSDTEDVICGIFTK